MKGVRYQASTVEFHTKNSESHSGVGGHSAVAHWEG